MRLNSKIRLTIILSSLFMVILLTTIATNAISLNSHHIFDDGRNNLWKWSDIRVPSSQSTDISEDAVFDIDSKGNVHFTWLDITDYEGAGSDEDIFYRKYNPTMNTWSNTTVLSTESSRLSLQPSIVIDSIDNIHVVWADNEDYNGAGTDFDIFYKKFYEYNSTWIPAQVVSTNSTLSSNDPAINVDSMDNLHILWVDSTEYLGSGTDEDIFYSKYDTSSNSWSNTEVVSSESIDDSNEPSIAINSQDDIHVVWHDFSSYNLANGDINIFYKKYSSSSLYWSNTGVLSSEPTDQSVSPDVDIDSQGNVHVVWQDSSDYSGSGVDIDVFYRKFTLFTSSWSTIRVLSSQSSGDSRLPSIAVDVIDNVHVIWEDTTDYNLADTDKDIFYQTFSAEFQRWTNSMDLSSNFDISFASEIQSDHSGNLHIAWTDQSDYIGANSYRDIFYRAYSGPPNSPEISSLNTEPGYRYTGISWDEGEFALGYNVYRSNSSLSEAKLIGTTNDTVYIDTSVNAGTYSYFTKAVNLAGESKPSNVLLIDVGDAAEEIETIINDLTTSLNGSNSDSISNDTGILAGTMVIPLSAIIIATVIARIKFSIKFKK